MTSNYERTTKACKKCRVRKPLREFGVNNKYKDHLQPKCRQCMRAEQRAYHNERRLAAAERGIFMNEVQRQAYENYGPSGILADVNDPRDRRKRGHHVRMRHVPPIPLPAGVRRTTRRVEMDEAWQESLREGMQRYQSVLDGTEPLTNDNLPTSWPPSPYRAYPVNVTPVDTDARHQPHNTIDTRRSHETPHEPRYPMPASVVRVAGIDFEDDDQGWMPLVDASASEAST